jgi:hypothetical protein
MVGVDPLPPVVNGRARAACPASVDPHSLTVLAGFQPTQYVIVTPRVPCGEPA